MAGLITHPVSLTGASTGQQQPTAQGVRALNNVGAAARIGAGIAATGDEDAWAELGATLTRWREGLIALRDDHLLDPTRAALLDAALEEVDELRVAWELTASRLPDAEARQDYTRRVVRVDDNVRLLLCDIHDREDGRANKARTTGRTSAASDDRPSTGVRAA